MKACGQRRENPMLNVALILGFLALSCTGSMPCSADEPPPVREVDIKYATVATTKHFNIHALAGMNDGRLQQEYQWCRAMADLCLRRCLAVIERYGPDAFGRLPSPMADGRLTWPHDPEPGRPLDWLTEVRKAERLDPANIPEVADAPEPWLLLSHTIEFQRHAARIQRYRGFVETAVEDYYRALEYAREVQPGERWTGWSPVILLDIAETYEWAKLYDEAKWAYEDYGKETSFNWHYHHGMAECYAGGGSFDEALQQEQAGEAVQQHGAYLTLFRKRPPPEGIDLSRPWPKLVREPAMKAYLKSLDEEGRSWFTGLRETYCTLARAYRRAGKLEEAEYALETARQTPWLADHGHLVFRTRLGFEVVREEAHLALAGDNPKTALDKADDCFDKYGEWLQPGVRVELHELASRALEKLSSLDQAAGELARARERRQAAMKRLEQAIELVEQGRASLLNDENRQAYFSSYAPLYRRGFELARKTEVGDSADGRKRRIRATFEWAERVKARATLDAIGRFDRLMTRAIERCDTEALCELRESARQVTSLDDLRHASWLSDDTAILEYTYAGENAYLHVVTRQREPRLVLLSASSKQIDTQAVQLARALDPRGPRDRSWVGSATWLYDHLLKPVERQLQGLSRLLIIADGRLRAVPFEVFVTDPDGAPGRKRLPESLLIEKYVIAYAPSATLANALAHVGSAGGVARNGLNAAPRPVDRKWRWDFVGVACTEFAASPPALEKQRPKVLRGEPAPSTKLARLPLANAEVRRTANLFGEERCQVFVNEPETRERLAELDLSATRFLHFATHAVEDSDRPHRSGLVLPASPGSPRDDVLPLRDIYSLDLGCEMVVLSACHTLGRRASDGDWIDGLARAFFCAGANSVVCTLQRLDDRAASLIADVYRVIWEDSVTSPGVSRADIASAVRRVKLPNLERHPAYWSGVVYFGLP